MYLFYNVALPFAVMAGLGFSVFNKKLRLSDKREILLTAAENAKQYQRSQAQMYEQQLLAELRETDMEVVELSETEKQAFQALLGDTYELVKNSMEHPEFMDAILE